jgi:RecA-family ATPase
MIAGADASPVTQFPVLDREAARNFLHYLDPDSDRFTFQTFTDSDQRKRTYKKHSQTGYIVDPLAKVLHGTIEEHWAALVDMSRRGAGVFVTINKTTLKGRRCGDNIVAVRAYLSDCDGVPQDTIKAALRLLGLMPQVATQTSAGRYHLLWCVDGAPLAAFKETQRNLAALFGSDPTVLDSPRVVRIPGFPHQKDGSAGDLVRVLHLNDADNYSDADFQRALAQALASRKPEMSMAERALAGLGNPSPDWMLGVSEGQRNTECARRAGAAISEGVTFDEALERCLRWNATLNDPPLPDDEVGSVVSSIWKTHVRNQSRISNGFFPPASAVSPALKVVRGDELLSRQAVPRSWLVDRFIPAEETTMIGGDGGIGKTTLVLQLVVAGISGAEWLGLKVAQCNFLYVSAEDPEGEIHFRFEQIAKGMNLTNEALQRFKLIDLAGENATIAAFGKDGQIVRTPLFAAIEEVAREHHAGCIIFDAVADFFGGSENERREVRAFVATLRGLAMRLKAAIVFIAHPSVDGIKTGRGYSGSTHWNNSVRSRLYFTGATGADGEGPPNPDLRVIELAKSNRARRGEKIHVMWVDGRFVTVAPGAIENLTNAAEADRLFLELLSTAIERGMNVSPNRSVNYAPVVLARMPAAKGIGKAALERAMFRLLERGGIRVEAFGPPSKVRQRLVLTNPSRFPFVGVPTAPASKPGSNGDHLEAVTDKTEREPASKPGAPASLTGI